MSKLTPQSPLPSTATNEQLDNMVERLNTLLNRQNEPTCYSWRTYSNHGKIFYLLVEQCKNKDNYEVLSSSLTRKELYLLMSGIHMGIHQSFISESGEK